MEYIIMNDEQRDIINIAKNSRKELVPQLEECDRDRISHGCF